MSYFHRPFDPSVIIEIGYGAYLGLSSGQHWSTLQPITQWAQQGVQTSLEAPEHLPLLQGVSKGTLRLAESQQFIGP